MILSTTNKYHFKIVNIIAFLTFFFSVVVAQSGREIAQMVDKVASPKDTILKQKMVLKNSKGKTRTNKMLSQSKDNNKKQIVWFLEPKDDKGVAFLKIEHQNKDDEMRMWLPDFKKIRRISSKRKGDSFMGSDMSYEDLTSRDLLENDYKRLPDEILSQGDCYVVEVRPKQNTKSSYSKHISWINKKTLTLVKEKSFDKREQLLKNKSFSHQKINNYYVMRRIFIEDVQSNHSTEISFDDIKIDTGLKDNLFQEKNLKRLPR